MHFRAINCCEGKFYLTKPLTIPALNNQFQSFNWDITSPKFVFDTNRRISHLLNIIKDNSPQCLHQLLQLVHKLHQNGFQNILPQFQAPPLSLDTVQTLIEIESYRQVTWPQMTILKQHIRRDIVLYLQALKTNQYTSCFEFQSNEPLITQSTATIEGICTMLNTMKYAVMDGNALMVDHATWALLFNACLEMGARYPTACKLLAFDHILTSHSTNASVEQFICNCDQLSIVNAYSRNSRTVQHQYLLLNKIFSSAQFWNQSKHVMEAMDYITEQQQIQYLWKHIQTSFQSIFIKKYQQQMAYAIQKTIVLVFENYVRYQKYISQILFSQNLILCKEILQKQNDDIHQKLIFKILNSYLIYSYKKQQSSFINPNLLSLIDYFLQENYLFSIQAIKALNASYEHKNENKFFLKQLIFILLTNSYDVSITFQPIYKKLKSILIPVIQQILHELQQSLYFQQEIVLNLLQRVPLEQQSVKKQQFLDYKLQKDTLLYENIKTFCLYFCPDLKFNTVFDTLLQLCSCLNSTQEQKENSLLSMICQEHPIETLRFIYVTTLRDQLSLKNIQNIQIWKYYWTTNRLLFIRQLAQEQKISTKQHQNIFKHQEYKVLNTLRRIQFIMYFMFEVFEKLNEESQQNIKQIKNIYDNCYVKIIKTVTIVWQNVFSQLIQKITHFQFELQIQDQEFSVSKMNIIEANPFLNNVWKFNCIGKINKMKNTLQVNKALFPCFIKINQHQNVRELICQKLLQLCLLIQNSFLNCQNEQYQVQKDEDWHKNTLQFLQNVRRLIVSNAQQLKETNEKIQCYVKSIVSKVLIPNLTLMIMQQKANANESITSVLYLMLQLDAEYQDHFMCLFQTLSEGSPSLTSATLLSLIQMFFELTLTRIRVRSYHLMLLIRRYLANTTEPVANFNAIINKYIKYLLKEFIPNRLPTIDAKCGPFFKDNFHPTTHTLSLVEIACLLSMFINLFSRLNFTSLTAGITHVLSTAEARNIYLQYLLSLTDKLQHQHNISAKEILILKVDVYGNLSLFTKFNHSLIQKILLLTSKLLSLKQESLHQLSKIPIKILTQKLLFEHKDIDLSAFEEEEKALSLGVLSMQRKVASKIESNLNYCNLWYLSPRHFDKCLELNRYRISDGNQVRQEGIKALKVLIQQQAVVSILNLLQRIKSQYDKELPHKYYGMFKILCITLQNNPQIICYVYRQVTVFALQTLKLTCIMFCQFYAVVLKCNSGFMYQNNQYLSQNALFEIYIRNELMNIQEINYPYLIDALCFTVKHSAQYRFRIQKITQIDNQFYKKVIVQLQSHFCDRIMQKSKNFTLISTVLEQIISFEANQAGKMTLDIQLRNMFNIQSETILNFTTSAIEPVSQSIQIYLKMLEQITKNNVFHVVEQKQQIKSQDRYQKKQLNNKQQNSRQQSNKQYSSKQNMTKQYIKGSLLKSQVYLQQAIFSNSSELLKEWPIANIITPIFQAHEQQLSQTSIDADLFMFQLNGSSQCTPLDDGIIEQSSQHQVQSSSQRQIQIISPPQTIDFIYPSSQQFVQQSGSEDGSIRIIQSQHENPIQPQSQLQIQHQPTKLDLLSLIEEYTLNPQLLKIIAAVAKKVPQDQLKKVLITSEGPVKYLLENQLLTRGVYFFKKDCGSQYEHFYVDQSKHFEDFDSNHAHLLHKIPLLHKESIFQLFLFIFKNKGTKAKTLIAILMLKPNNCIQIVKYAITILSQNSQHIHNLLGDKTINCLQYKKCIIEDVFGVMIQSRIGLPLLFYGEWLYEEQSLKMFEKEFKPIKLTPQAIIQNTSVTIYKEKNTNKSVRTSLSVNYINEKDTLNISQKQLISTSQKTQILHSNPFQKVKTNHSIASQKSSQSQIQQHIIQNKQQIMKLPPRSKFYNTHLLIEHTHSQSVLSIIFTCLLQYPFSQFLLSLSEYTKSVSRVIRYNYPYYDLTDRLTFSPQLGQLLSKAIHQHHYQLTEYFCTFLRLLCQFQMQQFHIFMTAEMANSASVLRKCRLLQEDTLNIYNSKHINAGDKYSLLRKQKRTEEYYKELCHCRRILSEIASTVINQLQINCFLTYYKNEDSVLQNQLARVGRAASNCSNYAEMQKKQQIFKQKEKEYLSWRKNLLNHVIKEEIEPIIESVSQQFLQQLTSMQPLCLQICSKFPQDCRRQMQQFYKLLLSYDLLTQEKDTSLHSMSLLKTNPSIYSTQDTSKRRSSYGSVSNLRSLSNARIHSRNLPQILKRLSHCFSSSKIQAQLLLTHIKHSHGQNKINLLHQKNNSGVVQMHIDRNTMWMDTLAYIDDDFKDKDVKVTIGQEIGLDYGGITKEWITLVAKEVVNPHLGLFQLSANKLSFQPSKYSFLVPNHTLHFFKFGLLVGKAMKENWLLEINFTKSFLKHILGFTLYVEDLDDIDPVTTKSLQWILHNDIGEDMGLSFCYEREVLGEKQLVELIPNGKDIMVQESNKKQYVKLLASTMMTNEIRTQSKAFMAGIETVIPYSILKLFDYKEIGLYLAGTPHVDVDEMRKYARYEGVKDTAQHILWLWEVLSAQSEEEKAQFLFFITGSYKVPFSGCKNNPITINHMKGCKDYLPVAHTCFSIIDLPQYSSKEVLSKQLRLGVSEGKGYSVS